MTVGTQEPFDRLIAAVDRWAGAHPQRQVFAQIGPRGVRPRHIPSQDFISPAECRRRIRDAELVVAHAGMGTVLSALEEGTMLLVMPRQAQLGEHRSDHQLATARWLAETGRASVAFDVSELERRLDDNVHLAWSPRICGTASETLVAALRDFIAGDPRSA